MDKNKSNIFPHVTKYFKFYEIYTYKVFSFSIMFVIEYPKPVEYAYIYSGNWGGWEVLTHASAFIFKRVFSYDNRWEQSY